MRRSKASVEMPGEQTNEVRTRRACVIPGATIREIAAEVGCSHTWVHRQLLRGDRAQPRVREAAERVLRRKASAMLREAQMLSDPAE